MSWFKPSRTAKKVNIETSEDVWVRCPGCSAMIYREEWEKELRVCPSCNYHERITCRERIELLIDADTFQELFAGIRPVDTLKFIDSKGSYQEKIEESTQKTGLKESVLTGAGKINRAKVVVAVMDFRFLGGSLGGATGEKIYQAALYAREHKLPFIMFSASGGARMQEGILSLMQMAKTCNAIAQLRQGNIPYISVLTDPTTGGVAASYALMGDINIAEPRALIGFAGRRVIEQTIRQKLPDNFQTAEYLLEHGFIDSIVARKDMKSFLSQFLHFYER